MPSALVWREPFRPRRHDKLSQPCDSERIGKAAQHESHKRDAQCARENTQHDALLSDHQRCDREVDQLDADEGGNETAHAIDPQIPLDPRLRDFVSTIVRSGVVPSKALPPLESEIARTVRWKDAWLPEAMCLLAAVLLSVFAQLPVLGKTAALEPTRAISDVPLGGLWYWFVCLPLFRFLLFRWIWRIALWCHFLWRLEKLDLHLVPTHPDGAAGLGYLEVVQTHLTALVLAISIVISASFAEDISSGKTVFEVIYPTLAITLIMDMALIALPPCIFAFKLRNCQEKGLSDYTVFAAQYVNGFEKKWLNSSAAPAEPLLGTPDLQSLADLSNSVGIVRNMRWVPVSTRLLILVVIAALLPMVPLLLFKYPIADLISKLFSKLAGL